MKIAFVTIGDTRDIKRGSGTPYHLWQELLRQGHTVHLVGPLIIKTPLLTRFFKWLSTHMGKRYLSYRDPFMGRALGQAAGRALTGLDVDVVLTNDYCLAGYTHADKPIILYTDDIFPQDYTQNINSHLANLSPFSVAFCQQTTARGLQQARRCFFASQYAADEAYFYLSSSPKSLTVIPYGANVSDPGASIPRSLHNRVNLLFVGKDWERKGGKQAVEVTCWLNRQGFKAHLHVAGVDLSAQYPDFFVTFHGLLEKDDPKGHKQLDTLFSTCHALLLPSKAEGYGLAFVEAAAYGMPSLAYATSGVKTAVQQGVSGILFNPTQGVEAFTCQIQQWMEHPEDYQTICRSARQHYEQTANWPVAVSRLANEMKDLI